MADGPNVEYKPQGEGAHPTLAGNILDPNVSADGKMQHGQGVGGTDESQIKKEGMEHIQSKIPQAQAPASNLGSDDTTGGLAAGSGGLSSSAKIGSPTAGETDQKSGGMMDTVKSYLGMGGSSAATSQTGTRDVGDENTNPKGSSIGDKAAEAAGVGAAGTGVGAAASSAEKDKGIAGVDPTSNSVFDKPYDSSKESSEPTTESTARDTATGAAGLDPASNTAAKTETPKDSDVTTGAPPTESADPTTKDTAQKDTEMGERKEDGEKAPQPAGRGTKGGLENKDAIPTAGGEKLGEKHWGQSQIVPDVPKLDKEGEGVASKDGQPDKQTADNTSKNTGGAKGNDEDKEKLVDKIKDKLHIGGKHKD